MFRFVPAGKHNYTINAKGHNYVVARQRGRLWRPKTKTPPRRTALFDLKKKNQGREGPAPAAGRGTTGAGTPLSRWARLRASLRARRTASAFWRAFFSEGFS